jgi:hypothetical protein
MGGGLTATPLACNRFEYKKGYKMKSFFILIICFTFISQTYSQDNVENHDFALIFGISRNFTLEEFNLDIAGKIILDETKQLRLMISPRLSTDDDSHTHPITGERVHTIETTEYSLGFAVDHLWTIATSGDFNLFTGLGLIVFFGNTHIESIVYPNDSRQIEETKINFLSSGLRGVLGAEWKASNNIGIHGEYILTGAYTNRKSEKLVTQVGILEPYGTSESKEFDLNSGILFGISIYF